MGSKEPGKITRIEWRGSAYRETNETPAGDAEKGRVALLIGAGGNRSLLADHLRGFCELVEPGGVLAPGSFDIAIVDIAGLRQWREQLLDAKIREEPTFLPVILVLSGSELRHRFRAFWDTIDEFIVSPIDRREFTERVSMLLRTRRLALAQRSYLAYAVNHDRVTGLPNKNLFMERLVDTVRDASILNQQFYVTALHIPLSHVMKSMGHYGLERVASSCSSRLVSMLREEVSIARLSAEEWGLIHRPGVTMNKVLDVCGRIRLLASTPFDIDGERIHLTPYIGVGIYPDDGEDAGSVLDGAMSALAEARANDSHEPVFYLRKIQHEALRFIRTETRLHDALEKRQFELWFQPQLDLKNEKAVAVEALVRWRLPGGELVPPGEFLPIAQSTGQIRQIDRWVLEHACATMYAWRRDKLGIRHVSVNVTAEDIEMPDFVEFVEKVLRKYQLPPPSLELELTESTLFKADGDNLDKLNRLRAYGISVAVDDFGQGYSSLSYLHKLPITTLKIDKGFVENVTVNPTDAAIAETIVWLARKFNLETVAEGVETAEQVEFLRAIDVSTAQGYFYAAPMPESKLREWLLKGDR